MTGPTSRIASKRTPGSALAAASLGRSRKWWAINQAQRRAAMAVILALALAPVTWLRSSEPPANHDQALKLVLLATGQEKIGPFRLAGVWHLTSRNSRFGSYSAMVTPAPGRLLAISDSAETLEVPAPGSGSAEVRIAPLPGSAPRHKHLRDVEAATLDPATGRIFLAFEGRNAVARHGSDLTLEAVRDIPEMQDWRGNTGPEAMVRLADGRFAVLCECLTGWFASGTHPGLLFAEDPTKPGAAKRFIFAGAKGYRPTDLALLPDGRILVLVRRLTWPMPARFRAKLLLADPAELTPDGTWRAVELAALEAPQPVDNFEALAVSPGADGALTAWLLSDDNRALSQRTLLWKLEFSLADLPAKQKAPESPDAPR